MTGSKPAHESVTVWSGLASILSGLATLALVLAGQTNPDAIGPAIVALVGGVGTIFGRYRATTVIE